jgi:signal recognition particle GTPase
MANSINVEGDNNLIFQNIKDSTITVHQNSIAKTSKELTLRIPKIHLTEVIGREDELEDLHKLLFDNKHVVVVNGLGGIGKTTLAQAYMSLYYDDYQHIA